MRPSACITALLTVQACFCSGSDYPQRRENLRKALKNGVTVLFGRSERDSNDLRSGFFQEPNFYYLTGWLEPGAILLLVPNQPHEILFVPRRDLDAEVWTGRKHGPDEPEIRGITGFATVLPAETFESEFRKYLEQYPKLYALSERPEAAKLKALAPLRDLTNAAPEIAKLRMEKSPAELALMQRAVDATIAAHRAAWKRAAPGLYEYQIAATMETLYFERGCERNAYAPIVGSGPNATVLHYSRNSRRMDAGELLLMDVGAECSGYAADITRTIPLNGKFTARQREIYDIVLGAQNAVIAAIKPGVTIGKTTPNSLYKIAYDYINTHGKDRNGEPLGKYFTHGVSHHIGLEVHDAADNAAALKEGMVISVEPGIYIPDESIGVRIEDVVLVTKNGAKVMSAALPRDAAEIEKALAR
jgi:Xaa-Pro aminopeptidase